MKYRKKPVVIDAWRFMPHLAWNPFPDWILASWFAEEQVRLGSRMFRGEQVMIIPTLEGSMTARAGDWIIRGVKGEVYPCKPDIFAETYEPVES